MTVLQPVNDRNVADRVADRLREAIETGQLAAGERLVERRLAAQLGVSHIPVREALARLADEGLVERLPRRGSRVAALTTRDVEEISTLRVILEELVAVRVQERLTPDDEAELRRIVAAMSEAARRGDGVRLFELDCRFHEALWRLSDHGTLIEIVAHLRRRINGFLRAANAALEPSALVTHAHTHADLLDAIAGDDPEAARAAIRTHILIAADRVELQLPVSGEART